MAWQRKAVGTRGNRGVSTPPRKKGLSFKPRLDPKGRMVVVRAELPAPMAERIERQAEAEERSVGLLITDAFVQYMARLARAKRPKP